MASAIPLYAKLKRSIKGEAERARMALEERLSLSLSYRSLSPAIFRGVRISGIVIADAKTRKKIAGVQSVIVSYSILKLLSRDLKKCVRLLTVNGLEVDFDREADFSVVERFSALINKNKEAGEAAGGKKKIMNLEELAARIPFDVSFKNTKLSYKDGALKTDVRLKKINFTFLQKSSQLLLNLVGSMRMTAGGRSVSCGFSTVGTLTDSLDGSAATFRITHFNGGMLTLDRLNFIVRYADKQLSLKTVQNAFPLFLEGSYHPGTGDAALSVRAAALKPSAFIRANSMPPLMRKARDAVFNLAADGAYNVKNGKLKFNADGAAQIPDALFAGGAEAAFSVSGGRNRLNVRHLSLTGERISARLSGAYGFADTRLTGSAVIERFVLKNGGVISTEVYFDPIDGGFMCFSPELFLDGKAFTALQLDVRNQPDSLDFSFELSDYAHAETDRPGLLKMNGSYLKGKNYVQTNVSADRMYLDSLAETGAFFTNKKPSLKMLSPYLFSGELFVSSDLKTLAFNVPYAYVANTKKDGQFVYLSLDGNDSTVQVTKLDYLSGGRLTHFSALLERAQNSKEVFFSADASSSSIPYHFAGNILPDALTVSGDYGFALDVYRSHGERGARIDGSFSADGFPLPALDTVFSLSLDTGFSYAKDDGFTFGLARFEAAETGNKFAFHPALTASGSFTKYGAFLNNIAYSDRFSTLRGKSELFINFNEKDFDSAQFSFTVKNPQSNESIDIAAELTNPFGFPLAEAKTGFYLNAQAIVTAIGLGRFTAEQNDANTVTATLIASGALENPYIGVNVEHFGLFSARRKIETDLFAYIEEKKLTIDKMNVRYNNMTFSDISASFDLAAFTGSLSATFDTGLLKRTVHVPLEFSISDTVFEEGKRLPSAFTAKLSSPEISGTLFRNPFPIWLSILKTPDSIALLTSEEIGISGIIDGNGDINFSAEERKPLYFNLSGNAAGKTLDIKLADFRLDAGALFGGIDITALQIYGGILRGALKISGLKSDPEFMGAASLSDADFALPTLVPSHIIVPKTMLIMDHNKISMAESRGTVRGSYPLIVSMTAIFERWAFSRLDARIHTPKGIYCPADVKLGNIEINGLADIDLNLGLEDKMLDVTGGIAVKKTTMKLKARSLAGGASSPQAQRKIGIRTDLNITLGDHTSFRFEPLLRAVFVPNSTLLFKSDSSESSFKVDGNLAVRSGDIAYLNRNFYLKSGTLKFMQQEATFNPMISVQAETREHDENGSEVRLILSAKNQRLLDFNPTFSSIPARSETQLRAMLGQIAVADSKNVSSFLLATGDYAIQSTIGRSVENKLRDFLNFDILSVRTSVLQNTVKMGLSLNSGDSSKDSHDGRSGKPAVGIGNFLDNSTVYVGKYFGSALYADALMHWTYDESRLDDKVVAGGLVFRPEFGLELESPFANIRWTTSPDIDAMLSNRIVASTSVTLSWKFSF